MQRRKKKKDCWAASMDLVQLDLNQLDRCEDLLQTKCVNEVSIRLSQQLQEINVGYPYVLKLSGRP